MTHPQSARLYAQWCAAIAAKDHPLAARLQRQLDDAFYAIHPNHRTRYSPTRKDHP